MLFRIRNDVCKARLDSIKLEKLITENMKSIFGFAFRYKEHRVCCIWCDIPHNFIKIYVWEGKSMLAYLCGKRTLVGEMAMSVVLF